MATQKLNLTRDQLATFLKNHEQIKQFERLFQIADEVAPSSDTTGISIQAGNADAVANEALAQIVRLAQDAAINSGNADQKAVQALDALERIAQSLQLLATAPAIQNNNSLTTDYIDLHDGGFVPSYRTGRMWFGNTGTLELAMGNGQITQQVGEEFFVYGKASTAIANNPLKIVYRTGTVGSSGVIRFAPTVAGITNGDLILGIATENIPLNGFGRVTSSGVVHGIATNGAAYGETWADGDEIWYNPVTGNPTKFKPAAPNIKVLVGVIINANSGGSGSIQVEINHGSVLGGTDSNVQITSAANGNILTYDGTATYWRNTALTAGSGISVTAAANGVLTVANTSPSSGGTVTSVALSAPTGFAVTGSPVITSGTLALGFSAGYSLPTNASQTNWDTAFSERRQWDGGSTSLVAATGRTSLGATTLGDNLFTITNPSAITFPRFNADNTVSSLDAATFRTAIGAGTGNGTVTSVGLSAPTGLTVSGSPVTSSGTLGLSFTAGYSIPTTASQANWDTAFANNLRWNGDATGLVAATGRTSLGATTLGSNLFTITNPSAITFPRFNADNTVSALTSSAFRSAIGAGTGNGTVTSVAALTLGTTGTDLSSTVANGTTTPVITLNVPTASATNRGALSSADWISFTSNRVLTWLSM